MLAINITGVKLAVLPWNGQVLDLQDIQLLSIVDTSQMLR